MEPWEVDSVLEASTRFGTNLWLKLPQEKNIIFPPINIHSLLLLISQDSGYKNAQLLRNWLEVHDNDKATECYRDILAVLNSLTIGRSLISSMVLRDKFELQEEFRNSLTGKLYYEVNRVKFDDEAASAECNAWVHNKTHTKIGTFVDSSTLSSDTRLALVNTMYYSGTWAAPFNADETVQELFYLHDNDSIEVAMMKKKTEAYYTLDEDRGIQVLELPYNDTDISLIIILPNKGTVKDPSQWFNFISASENLTQQEVNISLPRFKIEESLDLKSFFSKTGCLENEMGENACLFDMIENDEFLHCHKFHTNGLTSINEEGTVIGGATLMTLVPTNIDDEPIYYNGPTIYEMNINCSVSNRFAKNLVTCKVKNTENYAREATFTVVLPETAFITEFIMEVNGKSYKSHIKEKEEAKNVYNEALASGRSAGLVEANTRDSNEFTVSVNLEPETVAVFSLIYEEMLQRIQDQYELVLNIRPGQIVEKLNVEVNINESRPIKFVKTPPLRSGNEMNQNEKFLKPSTDIKIINSRSAVITFNPDSTYQKKLAHYLGTVNGFGGQFVVQYDVERDPQGGEILLQDGYFAHFFATNDLDPLPKHIVFVLDTSSSMDGRKLEQLKDAMMSILGEIRETDLISIIEFNSDIIVWDIKSESSTSFFYDDDEYFQDPFVKLKEFTVPGPAQASKEIIMQAKNVIQKMHVNGCTFMIGGLQMALYLVKLEQAKNGNYQPIIVFLTDGAPNVGISSTTEIVDIVTRLNVKYNKVPIFSLSFGPDADKAFLRQLSLKNQGFSRHIYEAADASLQLQAFYKQISSPLLSNIKFKYDSEVSEVTQSCFPIYFRGSELVVSGRYEDESFPTTINCCGRNGPIILKSNIERPVTGLERLWAYLTIKQLLDEMMTVDDKTDLQKKAIALALKYSFVTEVTSLVVVKPDQNEAIGERPSPDVPEQSSSLYDGQCKKSKPVKRRILKKCRPKKNEDYDDIILVVECEDPAEESPIEGTTEKLEPPQDIKPVNQFVANRPFLILLQLKTDNNRIILYVGKVYKPHQ